MNTISNRNKTNATNIFAQKSRNLVLTAVAVAALHSAVYAQTNSSSGINRQSAEQAGQSPAGTRRGTAASTPAGARAKAATTAKKAKRASSTSTVRRTRQTSSGTPRAVKITIRGNRADVRQARQQGMQSLQNANAAVAAREAQRAANAEAAINASNQAMTNANNGFQQPGDTSGYGFVPGFGYGNFGNPIASYGYGNSLYGSVSTTQPVLSGATPYGAPNQTFPSYYSNFGPGVYSSSNTFGPFGF